jgi:hypothetical protein
MPTAQPPNSTTMPINTNNPIRTDMNLSSR